MKTPSLPTITRRSLFASLATMLIPTSALLLSASTADARGRGRAGGVAVRGPRGGGVAVGGASRGRTVAPRGPASIHGTARRTARRTTRRIYTLPRGYTRRTMYGVSYYYYGGLYYEAYYEGSTVVYVQVEFN